MVPIEMRLAGKVNRRRKVGEGIEQTLPLRWPIDGAKPVMALVLAREEFAPAQPQIRNLGYVDTVP